VEQLARGSRPRDEVEVDEAIAAFKEARARSREALMLDVHLTDGTIVSFDYAHLAKSKLLPDGKMVLRFGSDEVAAEGKNLLPLYTSITEHRARYIKEGTDAQSQLKAQDAPHIEKITITEGIEEP
jgi:hypothetical protein